MLGKKIALLGTSVFVGSALYGSRSFHASAATRSNRVYTSIRNEFEFNPLLTLPNPLLANFCILTDPKSQTVSSVLEELVKSNSSKVPISSVDVEVDEPGNSELMQRYVVSSIPTIVLLEGGQRIQNFVPKGESSEDLKKEIGDFIDSIKE